MQQEPVRRNLAALGNANNDDRLTRAGERYYLPNSPTNSIPDWMQPAAFYEDGVLAFGLWLPSTNHVFEIRQSMKNKVNTRVPPSIIFSILCYILKLMRPITYQLPIFKTPPTVWMYNTLLILNNIFINNAIGTDNFILDRIIPLLFVTEPTGTAEQETRERLDALGRNNAAYINVSTRSNLGVQITQTVSLERQLVRLATQIFTKVYRQKNCISDIGATTSVLRSAFNNARFFKQLSVGVDVFVAMRLPIANAKTELASIRDYTNLGNLIDAEVAIKCPLSVILNLGGEINLNREPIHLENAGAGLSFCVALQTTPDVFISSAMLATTSADDRINQGGIAVVRAHNVLGGILNRQMNNIDIAPERGPGNAAIIAEVPNLDMNNHDIAQLRRAINVNQRGLHLIFERNAPFVGVGEIIAPAERIQEVMVPARPQANFEEFVNIRGVEVNQRQVAFNEGLLQAFNLGNQIMVHNNPQPLNQAQINMGVLVVNDFPIILNDLARPRAEEENEAVNVTNYRAALLFRNEVDITRFITNPNTFSVNIRAGSFVAMLNLTNNRARLYLDYQLTSMLGFSKLPRSTFEYSEEGVDQLIGNIDVNYEERENEYGVFDSPTLIAILNELDQNHILYFLLLTTVDNANKQLLYIAAPLPNAPHAQQFLSLSTFMNADVARGIRTALSRLASLCSNHPANIITDIGFICCSLYSFFSEANRLERHEFFKFSLVCILTVHLTALVVKLVDTIPASCIEYPLIWACYHYFANYMTAFRFQPGNDPRQQIPIVDLPQNQQQYVLCEIYAVANSNNNFLNFNIQRARFTEVVSELPIDYTNVPNDILLEDMEVAQNPLYGLANRNGLISTITKFNVD